MIDIHNHLLYGVDDGAKNIESTIEILRELEKLNIHDIILTPHYIKGSAYAYDNNDKKQRLESLKEKLRSEGININLYLGNEVMIDKNIIDEIAIGRISTLNNSKYILVEFPIAKNSDSHKTILKHLIDNGYIPILAHPERYDYYYMNIDFYISLIELGVLLQGNLKSLMGYYGKKAKRMIEELLAKDMIHFMATDVHEAKDIFYINKSIEKLIKITNSNKATELLNNNAKKVLENDNIAIYPIKDSNKTTFFTKLFENK